MIMLFKSLFKSKEEALNSRQQDDKVSDTEVKSNINDTNNIPVDEDDNHISDMTNINSRLALAVDHAFLKDSSLYVKIGYVVTMIDSINEKDINWDLVNRFLFENPIEYDYNINVPYRISSIEQMNNLATSIYLAMNDKIPFYQAICKKCNKMFTLQYGEIKFYQTKDLQIPKKCHDCRMSSKTFYNGGDNTPPISNIDNHSSDTFYTGNNYSHGRCG